MFYLIINIIMTLLVCIVLYPLIYIVSASFSSPNAVTTGKVVLWPVDFSLKGYEAVFNYRPVFIGYRNTIAYTLGGTFLNVAVTLCASYPLARRDFIARNTLMKLFSFTMVFSGGMIPTYLLMSQLKLVNTIIANTKGDGEKSSEDFWVKAERLLYCALIGYIYYEAPESEKHFTLQSDHNQNIHHGNTQ